MTRRLRVATAQYPLDWLDDWSDVAGKLGFWVGAAADEGAELLVFPEYGSMELASLGGPDVAADLDRSLHLVADKLEAIDQLHVELAAKHGVTILAASAPMRKADGKIVNVARLMTPTGAIGRQEKRVMTRFEAEKWVITPGDRLTVFDLGKVKVGVAICYDVEFPLVVRPMVEAGAEVILAPSTTETRAGSTRVHTGAKARALENQCYVVVSQTVGEAGWTPSVELSKGHGAIYCPSDIGFPETGVIAEGEADKAQWVFADLDLDALTEVRAHGTVLNHRDWAVQPAPFELAARMALS